MFSVGVIRLTGFLLVSGLIGLTKSYPFGAGLSACKTLIPGHGKEPQPMETLPFMIEPESDYFTMGKVFKVRIRTISGKFKNRKIGGFFLQARAPGTTDAIGRWEVHHEESVKFGMKGQNCSYPFDSVTHSDSKPKNADMVLHFMPTQNTPDQIQFMGTIARDYGTFWANVKSTVVTKRFTPPAAEEEEEATTEEEQELTTMTTPTTTHKLVAHHHRTTILPKRIHHVTQHISSHTTHRPHRATHHPRRTTTSSTTKDPVTKTVHHVKLDPDEKYLEEKEVASLISKNELETVKQRGGHRDDETDRVQNDGSTNPDSQSSVKKLSQSSAASSLRVGFQTTRISCSSVLIQIAVFLSCCLLRVL